MVRQKAPFSARIVLFWDMTHTELILAIGLLALFAALVLIFWSSQRARGEDLRRADEARQIAEARAGSLEQVTRDLLSAQSEMKGQMGAISEAQTAAQLRTLKLLEERFDGITGKMNVSLSESAEKTTKSLGELATRLAIIDEAQKNITELSGQVVGLQHILDNKQERGAFGEIRMVDIFQSALPPSAYAFQHQLPNGRRADAFILLPNPPGPIVVDSKFPLEAWRGMQSAETDSDQKAAAAQFRTAVKKHISDIASKYIIPGETAESALMFLPSESVYAELHANFEDLLQESYKARVYIVSPTTLMATLNTVRAILKDVAMQKQAHLIQAQVGKMMEDVSRLEDRVAKLASHFGQAQKDIGMIQTSTAKVLRHGEKINEIELDSPEVDRVTGTAQGTLTNPDAAE